MGDASLNRRSFLGGMTAVGLLALLDACTTGPQPAPTDGTAPATGSTTSSVTPPSESPTQLLLRAVRASPDHLTARAAEVVAAADADRIVAFVRDTVTVLPHRPNSSAESDRGWAPAATLRAGAGTPRDRVELAAALLTAAGFTASAAVAARPAELTVDTLYQVRTRECAPDQALVDQALAAARAAGVTVPDPSAGTPGSPVDDEVDTLAEAILNTLTPDARAQFAQRADLLPDRLPLVSYQVGGTTRYSFAVGAADPTSAAPDGVQPAGESAPNGQVTVTVHGLFNPPAGSHTPATSVVDLVSGTWPLDQLLGRPLSLTFDAAADPDTVLQAGPGAVPVRIPSLRPQPPMADPAAAVLPAAEAGAAAHGTPITLWGEVAEVGADADTGLRIPGPAGPLAVLGDAELAAARARVASVSIGRLDAAAFPTVGLDVRLADASGGSVDGVDAASFTVTEDGAPMTAILTANAPDTRRPRVLVIYDGSGSVSDTFGTEAGQAAFNETVAAAIVDAAGRAPFDVQVITLGGIPTGSGWAPPTRDGLSSAFAVFSFSDVWSTIANAGRAGVNAMVMISDNVTTETPEQVAAFQRIVGSRRVPVVCLPVGTPDRVATTAVVQLSGGSEVDPNAADFGRQLAAALAGHLEQNTQTTYRLSYPAPAAGTGTRTVTVAVTGSAGSATGTYQPPAAADRLAPASIVGIYLTVAIDYTSDFRVLGGRPLDARTSTPDGAPDAASAADATSVVNGLTTILVEPAVPTAAAALDDVLAAHLSWEPLRPVVASPTIDGLTTAAAGFRRYPTLFAALFAPANGLGNGSVSPASGAADGARVASRTLTTVVMTQRPDPAAEVTADSDAMLVRVDLSPVLNQVTATSADPATALRGAVRESLLLSAGEGLLSDTSAHARLRGRALTLVPFGAVVPDALTAGLPGTDAAAVTRALNHYANYHRLVPSDGAPDAFWVVDPTTATTLAISPDGTGGSRVVVDVALLYQALNLAFLVLGLGCTLGGTDRAKGPAFYYTCVGLTVSTIGLTAAGLFPSISGSAAGPGTAFGVFSTLAGATTRAKTPTLGGRIGVALVVIILYLLSLETF